MSAATSTTDSTTTNTTNTPTFTTDPTAPTNTTSAPTSTTGSAALATKTSTPTPSTNTPGSRSPCQKDPCKGGSSCVNLHDRWFCLCLEGYYYNTSTCNKGKIFPGTITVNIASTSGLEDENSMAYQELHFKITKFFEKAFDSSDYGQTVIGKLSTSPSARSAMHTVDVAVVNIFLETTKQTEETVSRAIERAIKHSANEFTSYIEQDRCDYYGCEKENGQDDCTSGLLCQCKPGLLRPNPQIPQCVALGPKCPDDCNTQNTEKQCLVKDSWNATCVCPPGYKEDDRGICQQCAFGYSGVDCEDSFQLILTIVGTIAGILILGLVIAIILVSSMNKRRNVEQQKLIENDFQNRKLRNTGFSNLGADGSIFPKINMNLPKESQPQNPYVIQGGIPRADY
ncbi:mucin-13 [Delphinapterus leucas]|uniref:Mucin-13 n=1 Tax=Delphinapterus leucas TaxID=9749 RepID=A0A2Y9MMU0_DELLE|nr:mucin-13 [Delphinapterus leucas]